jgi:hypothetical protein
VYEVQEKTKRMMFLMASLQKQIRLLSQCDSSQFDEEMRTASKLKVREMTKKNQLRISHDIGLFGKLLIHVHDKFMNNISWHFILFCGRTFSRLKRNTSFVMHKKRNNSIVSETIYCWHQMGI